MASFVFGKTARAGSNRVALEALALLLPLLLWTGCQTSTGPKFDPRAKTGAATLTNLTSVDLTNRIQPDWLQSPSQPFRLGPGDKIEIEIIGEAGTRSIVTVMPDGKIYYYLLPGLDVWGLTVAEARAAVERELAKLQSAPQVSMHLRGIESKRVWLLGRLQNAGAYSVASPITLLESISLAGGPMTSSASGTTEELADLRHSFVVREGRMLPVNLHDLLQRGDTSQNIYLQPDDLVYLPSALSREIYVLGAVRNPRTVGLLNQTTLVSAIANAGGPIKNAYLSQVAILRGSLTQPMIATVDYMDIVKGRAPDILLEPRDIVYVPLSPWRYLSKYADLIVTTFVRAVAVNEGARAVSRSAGPAGVSISVGPNIGVSP